MVIAVVIVVTSGEHTGHRRHLQPAGRWTRRVGTPMPQPGSVAERKSAAWHRCLARTSAERVRAEADFYHTDTGDLRAPLQLYEPLRTRQRVLPQSCGGVRKQGKRRDDGEQSIADRGRICPASGRRGDRR